MLTGEGRDRKPGHLAHRAGRGRRCGRGTGRVEAHRDARGERPAATAAGGTGQHRAPRLPGAGPDRGSVRPGRADRGPGLDRIRARAGDQGRRHRRRHLLGQPHPARRPVGHRGPPGTGPRPGQEAGPGAQRDAERHREPGADQPVGGHRARARRRGDPGDRGDGPGAGGRAGQRRRPGRRALRGPGHRLLVHRAWRLHRPAHPGFPDERERPGRRRHRPGLYRCRAAARQHRHRRGRGTAQHGQPVPGQDAARDADGRLAGPHQRRAGGRGGPGDPLRARRGLAAGVGGTGDPHRHPGHAGRCRNPAAFPGRPRQLGRAHHAGRHHRQGLVPAHRRRRARHTRRVGGPGLADIAIGDLRCAGGVLHRPCHRVADGARRSRRGHPAPSPLPLRRSRSRVWSPRT